MTDGHTHNHAALSVALTALLLSGCTGNASLSAAEALNHQNCKAAATGLHQVTFADVARLRGATLLSMPPPDAESGDAAEDVLLFALSNGPKPTAGYRFQLERVRLVDQVATIEFRWHTPTPDHLQAQMVTSPCLVVGIERGSYHTVRAVDTEGNVLGELRI